MNNRIIEEDINGIWNEMDFSEMEGKEVMITGGSGLIGTYLIYTMIRLNRTVENKNRIYIIIHRNLPEYLAFLENDSDFIIIRGDLSDYSFCESLPMVDYIIHAAGYAQPGRFLMDRIKTIRLNVMATDVLLSKLKFKGKFLFVSSASVYIGSTDNPTTEKSIGGTMPDHPRSCYIEGKRCGEAVCCAYAAEGKHVRIARVSVAYGPGIRNDDKRALYNFIQMGAKGNISLLDNGEGIRTYCYIVDTISNLWNILLHGKDIIYNVGGHSRTTILELARNVATHFNVKVVLPEHCNALQGAPVDDFLDMSKTDKEFSKKRYVSLDVGLRRTIDWYENNLL